MTKPEAKLIVDGLGFLEGPVALDDGSLLVVDLRGSCVWHLVTGRAPRLLAESHGGLNGAAPGPDGRLYVCNNGGLDWREGTPNVPLGRSDSSYIGGAVQRIDLATGAVTDLYREWRGEPLRAPNDLVFDRHGGFYFTDHASDLSDRREHGAVYYATADGASIERVAFPLDHPNGIALSPEGSRLYMADSLLGGLWFWDVRAPGDLVRGPHRGGATLLARLPGLRRFDSIAVDAAGNVVAATLDDSGGTIEVFAPAGDHLETLELPDADPFVTNVCFGGPGFSTAYVTSAGLGRVYALPWPGGGLPLAFDFVGHAS